MSTPLTYEAYEPKETVLVKPELPPDAWRPASNGTETVFTSRNGVRMLYCWQPSSGRHAYLNVDTDIIMTDEEASNALGWR